MNDSNQTDEILALFENGREGAFNVTSVSFTEELFNHIDTKGLKDVDVYKRANIDRRLFSKIRKGHIPGKNTIIALALVLELNYTEAVYFLSLAGFTLSQSIDMPFDIIIANSIIKGIYSIDKVNELLFQYGLPLL